MNKDEYNFHLEEFKQMKAEIAALFGVGQTLMRYALVVSAGVFAWLAVQGIGHDPEFCIKLPKYFLKKSWYIPFGFAIFGSLAALMTAIRLWEISKYLRRVENALGNSELGWEKWFSPRFPFFKILGTIFWFILLGINFWVAYEVGQFIESWDYCQPVNPVNTP